MPRTKGRTTKLTPAIQTAIVNAVTGGVPYEQAALLADISPNTAREWLARGEGRDPDRPATPLYAAFAVAIEKARAADEARRILRINQAGQGGAIVHEKTVTYPDGRVLREVRRSAPDWQSDAWHLERTRPERYGRKAQIDLSVDIRAMAARVAEKMGLDVDALLRQAQQLLDEAPRNTEW
jgi:hypothetical protein